MKEYEVKMVFDLTKPEGDNLYNSIRSLDGIKNAIAGFKNYLDNTINEIESSKGGKGASEKNLLEDTRISEIKLIRSSFEESFKEQGINV